MEFIIRGTHGEITTDSFGYPINYLKDCDEYDDIKQFDIAEWLLFWGKQLQDLPRYQYVDILDFGYWLKNGKYVQPEWDWRKELVIAINEGSVQGITLSPQAVALLNRTDF